MSTISNYTFQELTLGQTATYSKTVETRDIELFATLSGDVNPIHLDPDFAANTPFERCIAHGMLSGAVISAAIAMQMPGPGSIYRRQSLRFHAPVFAGDTINVKLEIIGKKDQGRIVTLDCKAMNQHQKLVVSGSAEVMAPAEKMSLIRPQVSQT
ncbi:MAG: MaoC family dehydratase [Halioglobus sp.]|nr:MaoC family dehydratase [Halioglobus sp.]